MAEKVERYEAMDEMLLKCPRRIFLLYYCIVDGCRSRAYEESGDMMATDRGCWLAR